MLRGSPAFFPSWLRFCILKYFFFNWNTLAGTYWIYLMLLSVYITLHITKNVEIKERGSKYSTLGNACKLCYHLSPLLLFLRFFTCNIYWQARLHLINPCFVVQKLYIPQFRQWCRRRKAVKCAEQRMQSGAAMSGTHSGMRSGPSCWGGWISEWNVAGYFSLLRNYRLDDDTVTLWILHSV